MLLSALATYAASLFTLRSGFASAVTGYPFAWSLEITAFQPADSANAPCTSTIVGLAAGGGAAWTSEASPTAASRRKPWMILNERVMEPRAARDVPRSSPEESHSGARIERDTERRRQVDQLPRRRAAEVIGREPAGTPAHEPRAGR